MSTAPPLKGDGAGLYRVRIVGNSGTGKSTLAAELAQLLGVPCIHTDRLFWNPGWVPTEPDALRERVRAALDGCARGWVVDGNYERHLQGLVGNAATDVIWLDPPFLLYFPRICMRTLRRLLRIGPPCAPGCEESVREVFFSKKSIIWWCITNHWPMRRKYVMNIRQRGIEVGGNWRRLGGWGRQLAEWKQAVREMCRRE